MRPSLAFIAAGLVLAACTTSDAEDASPTGAEQFADDPRLGEEVDRICFASNIDSFGDTTRDTFTVREGRDYYLIDVYSSCFALDDAMSIVIDSTGSCLTRGDHVIVSDSIMGPGSRRSSSPFGTQRCTVQSMYKWDPKARADAEDDTAGEDSGEPAEES